MPNGTNGTNGNGNGFRYNGNGNGKIDLKTLIEWMGKFASFVLIPLLVWVITLLIQLDKKVALIEVGTFPMSSGIELQQMSAEHIATDDREMSEMMLRIVELEKCQIKIRLGNPNGC